MLRPHLSYLSNSARAIKTDWPNLQNFIKSGKSCVDFDNIIMGKFTLKGSQVVSPQRIPTLRSNYPILDFIDLERLLIYDTHQADSFQSVFESMYGCHSWHRMEFGDRTHEKWIEVFRREGLLGGEYDIAFFLHLLSLEERSEELEDYILHYRLYQASLVAENMAYSFFTYENNKLGLDRICQNIKPDIKGEPDLDKLEKNLERLGVSSPYEIAPYVYCLSVLSKHEKSPVEWQDYENEVLKRLEALGFNGELTPSGADFGADIVCEKDGLTYVIQCKHRVKPAGVSAVQEAAAARSHYIADYAAVISSSGFTRSAEDIASSNNVFVGCEGDIENLEKFR